VSEPLSAREIINTRVFDAPRERAFRASTDPAHLARWWGPTGFDVRAGGTLVYYASNFARYRLLYAARARLVDTEPGRVVWQSVCDFRGADDPAQSPPPAEVEAADRVTYRRLIVDATSQCAAELLKQYRGQAP
jgi:hypothetical protein